MKGIIKLAFLNLLSLMCFVEANNVVISTYRGLKLVSHDITTEIERIFSSMSLKSEYANATVKDRWYLKTQRLNITNLSLEKLRLEIAKVANVSLVEKSSVAANGDFFNITFSFNYSYRCYCSDFGTGRILFRATNASYLKKYNFTEKSKKKSGLLSFVLVYDSFELSGGNLINDTEVLRLTDLAISTQVRANVQETLLNLFNAQISDYYDNLNEQVNVSISTNIPSANTFLFSNSEEIEGRNLHKGVVNYLTSSFNEIIPTDKLRNLRVAEDTWDKFIESDGELQIFFHENNLSNLINYISSRNEISYLLNKNDSPKELSYSITVDSLSKFYPDILNTNAPDEQININIQAHSLSIKPLKGKVVDATFSTENVFNLADSNTTIFEMSIEISLQFKFEVNGDFSVNVVVPPSGLKVDSINVPPRYNRFNLHKLTQMINEAYTDYLRENPFYLFKKPLPLNQYFARIYDIKFIEEEGILFIGDPLSLE